MFFSNHQFKERESEVKDFLPYLYICISISTKFIHRLKKKTIVPFSFDHIESIDHDGNGECSSSNQHVCRTSEWITIRSSFG